MTIAENNYEYEEQQFTPITGWRKVCITEITEPELTKQGNATGFWINLDVWDGDEIVERGVWLSFDHPSEFVQRKSKNIGAMLRMMFPAVTNDKGYNGGTFWLLFKTYKDKNTGQTKESFFDFKDNVSLNGKETLNGNFIGNAKDTPKSVSKPSPPSSAMASNSDEDVPF